MDLRRSVCGLLVGGLVLLSPSVGRAQEKQAPRKNENPRDGIIARVIFLMPPAFAVELHLKPEQRSKIQRLEEEFRGKRREALIETAGKVMTIVEGLQNEDDFELAPVLAICHEITGGLLSSRRTRMAYEIKMLAILDEQQVDEFHRLKEMGPRERRLRRAGDGSEEAEAKPFPSPRQTEQLKLSDEQKQKLSDLHQEMETRFRNLLTAEQRQRLDQQRRDQNPARPPVNRPKPEE